MDTVQSTNASNGQKRVLNKGETLLALEKQKKITQKFQKWIWTDENRKEWLQEIFENNFGSVSVRRYDGSFLDFSTMSNRVQLYDYQKNSVARILFSKNTLLAHAVGAGKA